MSLRRIGALGVILLVAFMVVALILGILVDTDSNAEKFTKDYVQQAINRYNSSGREATVAHYNSPGSVNGEWYIFIIDENETMIAHPTRKDRIGTTREDRVDVNGYYYGDEFASATEDGKWVTYSFTNPTTGQIGKKHTWIVKHDGLFFGSGWYEN